jgi:hypothetical protein
VLNDDDDDESIRRNLQNEENELTEARRLSNNSPEDCNLSNDALVLKNRFEKTFYTLTSRSGNKIASNIWKYNYGKLMELSKKGNQMIKQAGKYYTLYRCHSLSFHY